MTYIDSLCGLCMLMVVCTHNFTFGLPGTEGFAVNDFILMVFMALFFFISGFVVYKSSVRRNLRVLGKMKLKSISSIGLVSVP